MGVIVARFYPNETTWWASPLGSSSRLSSAASCGASPRLLEWWLSLSCRSSAAASCAMVAEIAMATQELCVGSIKSENNLSHHILRVGACCLSPPPIP